MKVLVLGASGSIGLPVAQALVRGGHTVYGLTRTEQNAAKLMTEEIIPVVCQVSETASWTPLVATLDVVIDAVGGSADLRTLSAQLLSATAEAARQHRPSHAPKLTYIYTSGTWVHGDNRKDVKSDTSPITSPAELVAWRPAQEQRPALLYGRSGSLLAPMFENAYKASTSGGPVEWFGTPTDRWALIHVDDLAELFLLASEKAPLAGGKIFDAANDYTELAEDILSKVAQVAGVQGGIEFVQPQTPYEIALTIVTLLRPYLGRALLNWRPRKTGFVDNMETYYNAWKATNVGQSYSSV